MGKSPISDGIVAGGGIIGLSIALELRRRGLSVMVLERGPAMQGSSWAAGGMLAAEDPENPAALGPFSRYSLALYPEYLERIEAASGQRVPLRTFRTLQRMQDTSEGREVPLSEAAAWIPGLAETGARFEWLQEQSFDPRDLCRALPAALQAMHGRLLEQTAVLRVERSGSALRVHTEKETIETGIFVNCCGAWAGGVLPDRVPVAPVKGQMATVALAPDRLRCVLRTPEFYAIPRGDGRVTVGATVEHAGYDLAVEEESIGGLLGHAAMLLPELGAAPRLECWAGLRPGTPDGLPLVGAGAEENCWHATGHYRNGVLLAPGTARLMAQLIAGEALELPVEVFSPLRFAAEERSKAEA